MIENKKVGIFDKSRNLIIISWTIFVISYLIMIFRYGRLLNIPGYNLTKYSFEEYIFLFLILFSAFVLILIRRDFCVYILIISVLFPLWVYLPGKSITSENFIILICLLAMIIYRKEILENFPSKFIFLPFLIFIFAIGIAQLVAYFYLTKSQWMQGTMSATRFIWQMGTIFLVFASIKDRKQMRNILIFSLFIATGTVIYGFLQWCAFSGVGFLKPLLKISYTRFYGDIESIMYGGGANPYASYLIILMPILIVFLLQSKSWKIRSLLILLFAIFGWVFIYTYSRAIYFAMLIVFLFFLIMVKDWRKRFVLLMMIAFFAMMFFMPGKLRIYTESTLARISPSPSIQQKIEKKDLSGKERPKEKTLEIPKRKMPYLHGIITIWNRDFVIDLSSYHRILLWQIGYRVFKSYPITGSGYYTFGQMIPKYEYGIDWNWPINVGSYHYPNAHSDFVQMFADLGVIGGLSFLTMMLCILYLSFKNHLKQKQDTRLNLIYLGLFGSVLGCFLSSMFQNNFADSRVYGTFWILVGIVIFIYQSQKGYEIEKVNSDEKNCRFSK